MTRWPSPLHRISALIGLGTLPGTSMQNAAQVAWLFGVSVIQLHLSWQAWVSIMSMCRAAITGSYKGVLAESVSSIVMVLSSAALEAHFILRRRMLIVTVSNSALLALHRRTIVPGSFLRVTRPYDPCLPRVENPLQRIAESQDVIFAVIELLVEILRSTLRGMWMMRTLLGGAGLQSLTGFAMNTALNLFTLWFAPDWRSFVKKTQTLDTRFQVLHSRLRHNAEPVAFSGGGGAERQIIERQFDALHCHAKMVLHKDFVHSWLSSIFRSYDMVPIVLQRSIAYIFNTRNNPAFQHPHLGVAPSLATITFLFERVVTGVQDLFGTIVSLATRWPELDGRIVRILELVIAIQAAEKAISETGARQSQTSVPSVTTEVAVRCLDLVTPTGRYLAHNIAFDLQEKVPILITGPNASGKSLLGYCLLGVMPLSGTEARVVFPRHGLLSEATRPPVTTFMAVTQRIYLPTGKLGDQVCYPRRFKPAEMPHESKMKMYWSLKASGLGYILEREPKGWHAIRSWDNVLSGGEQQRMCLARLFFHRPKFALLDECTYMIAVSSEEQLYRDIIHTYGITPLTLTQRLFLSEFHPTEIRLGTASRTGWELVETCT